MSHFDAPTNVSRREIRNSALVAPIRHGRLKKSHPVATIIKFLAAFVAVIAVSAASVAGAAVVTTISGFKGGIALTPLAGSTGGAAAPEIGEASGEVNILIAGSDTRTGQAGFQDKADLASSAGLGNNDVTMLLHVSADHSNATIVSFPRDLVNVPICGRSISGAMFNSTLSRGLPCTVNTVEKMTGLTIPYAGVIDFDGVTAMSDAVKGVTVCLASPVKDKYTNPQLNLTAGQHTLVGAEALSFLRSRHGVGNGSDLGRISNQQVFLSALLRKITSDGVLSNPVSLFKLATAATDNLHLSQSLVNPTTLISLALTLKNIPLDNIVFVQYPTIADPQDPNRVIPQLSSAAALTAALRSDSAITLSGQLGVGATTDQATTPSAPPAPAASGAPTTSPAPSATPSPSSTSVALPSNITGQKASQATCTKGNN